MLCRRQLQNGERSYRHFLLLIIYTKCYIAWRIYRHFLLLIIYTKSYNAWRI